MTPPPKALLREVVHSPREIQTSIVVSGPSSDRKFQRYGERYGKSYWQRMFLQLRLFNVPTPDPCSRFREWVTQITYLAEMSARFFARERETPVVLHSEPVALKRERPREAELRFRFSRPPNPDCSDMLVLLPRPVS